MERTENGRIIAVADTSVLINFLKIERMDILKNLRSYQFCVPNHVVSEIKNPRQKKEFNKILRSGIFQEIVITDFDEIALYDELHRTMGNGESACLALAVKRNWVIASDEKGLFRKEVKRRLGKSHLLNTIGILVEAIKEGLISIEEADKIKEKLTKHSFLIKIRSFRDLDQIKTLIQRR